MEEYIKKSDILAIVNELQGSNINKFRYSVEDLPTIINPRQVVQDFMDKNKLSSDYYTEKMAGGVRSSLLSELLEEFNN